MLLIFFSIRDILKGERVQSNRTGYTNSSEVGTIYIVCGIGLVEVDMTEIITWSVTTHIGSVLLHIFTIGLHLSIYTFY